MKYFFIVMGVSLQCDMKIRRKNINIKTEKVMETMTLMQSIREAAAKLKEGKLKKLNQVATHLKNIVRTLGLEKEEEAMIIVAIMDRQCCGRNSDLDDISNYFGITSLDVMQFVPSINNLVKRGFLSVENRDETDLTRRQFLVSLDVFGAIIEGREVKPIPSVKEREYDQFAFCKAVHDFVSERRTERIETQKLFALTQRMEEDHADLQLVKDTVDNIDDLEARTFFYEMCNDFTSSPEGGYTTIGSTLADIYDRVLDKATVKLSLLQETHPLMKAKLIKQSDEDELRLSADGIRILLGDKAGAYIKSCKVADRFEFVNTLDDYVCDMRHDIRARRRREHFALLERMEGENEHLGFVGKVKGLIQKVEYRFIFYQVCYEFTRGNEYRVSNLECLFDKRTAMCEGREIKNGTHQLVKSDLVSLSSGELMDNADLELTDKGKELFLEEDLELFEKKVDSKDLILPSNIAEKHLYFEPNLQRQLSMIGDSLKEENFKNLRKRLEEKGMAKGVAVLLYGNPGTGKTESVMQMAKETGRAIVHVDISATKTCWFGESEKLIKRVFTNYKNLCKRSELKPILLFNEADAVFSKRKDSNSSSVAQTENAIQNIILEEIENLDGILIATTNLADNLDKAFERRFLFKVRFDRPTAEAKQKIWADKMPTLTGEETMQLASKYDFSGGEIDNITKKAIMLEVIEGVAPTMESLMRLCDEEKIASKRNKIGFMG